MIYNFAYFAWLNNHFNAIIMEVNLFIHSFLLNKLFALINNLWLISLPFLPFGCLPSNSLSSISKKLLLFLLIYFLLAMCCKFVHIFFKYLNMKKSQLHFIKNKHNVTIGRWWFCGKTQQWLVWELDERKPLIAILPYWDWYRLFLICSKSYNQISLSMFTI